MAGDWRRELRLSGWQVELSGWGLEMTMDTLQLWTGDDNGYFAAVDWR